MVLKGGVALLLRLDPNRTSDDIDIASYLDAAGEHGVALAALERALALDLGDHFSFAVRPGERDPRDAGLDETIPLLVEARIGGRRWVEFGIDLGYTDAAPDGVAAARENLTGLAEVDAIPAVRSLALDLQVAHKLCAMFELHASRPSTPAERATWWTWR